MENQEMRPPQHDTMIDLGVRIVNLEGEKEAPSALSHISIWKNRRTTSKKEALETGVANDIRIIGLDNKVAIFADEDDFVLTSLTPNQTLVTGGLESCVGIGLYGVDPEDKPIQSLVHFSRYDWEKDGVEVDPMESFEEYMSILKDRGINILELASVIPSDIFSSVDQRIRHIAKSNPGLSFASRPLVHNRFSQAGMILTANGGSLLSSRIEEGTFSSKTVYYPVKNWAWNKLIR